MGRPLCQSVAVGRLVCQLVAVSVSRCVSWSLCQLVAVSIDRCETVAWVGYVVAPVDCCVSVVVQERSGPTFVFSQFTTISPEPNRRLTKTVLVWICNENNFKKLVVTLHRKYNPTEQVTENTNGIISVELSHAIKLRSKSQKSNRFQAYSKLSPHVRIRDHGDHLSLGMETTRNIGDKQATSLAKRSF